MALTAYLAQTQRLLHDPQNTFYSQADLTAYINIARRWVATEANCVRVLLSGGTIANVVLGAGGAGYVSPKVTINGGGGFQGQISATQTGGVITALSIVLGGYGYLTTPTLAITDAAGPGAGATATCSLDNSASTVTGQEFYLFSTLNTIAAQGGIFRTPGVSQVIGIISIACSQGGTYKPTLTPLDWSIFQAQLRIYQNQAQNYPIYWSQFGQGAAGTFAVFPWPSQVLPMDIDAYCLPVDLASDSTPEAIPSLWTDAIPYYAAYLAYDNSQRADDAKRMLDTYDNFMRRARKVAEPPRDPAPYGEDF